MNLTSLENKQIQTLFCSFSMNERLEAIFERDNRINQKPKPNQNGHHQNYECIDFEYSLISQTVDFLIRCELYSNDVRMMINAIRRAIMRFEQIINTRGNKRAFERIIKHKGE